jgi:membrane protease YdiL (CAAX protease family)
MHRLARLRLPIWLLAFPAAWIGAWLAHEQVARATPALADRTVDTIYWWAAKLLIWVAPAIFCARREGSGLGLGLPPGRAAARAGLWAAAWLVRLLIGRAVAPHPHAAAPVDLALINAVCVAPFVEELAFRGWLLGALARRGVSFTVANGLVALGFAAIHLPGQAFQHRLAWPASLVDCAGLALFGLLLGLCRRHVGSTWGPILVHAINNAFYQLSPIT